MRRIVKTENNYHGMSPKRNVHETKVFNAIWAYHFSYWIQITSNKYSESFRKGINQARFTYLNTPTDRKNVFFASYFLQPFLKVQNHVPFQ